MVPFTFKVGGGLGWYLPLILSTFFQTLAILGIAVECGHILLPRRVLGIFLHPLEHCTQALIFDFVANSSASVCLFLGLQTLFLEVCAISIPPTVTLIEERLPDKNTTY